MTSLPKDRELWVGRVDVEPMPGNNLLGYATGAFANTVVLASNGREFQARVMAFFERLGFRTIAYEDVEPLRERLQHYVVPKAILDLANAAVETDEVQFDTFFIYEEA